jgi:transposase
LSLLAGGAPVWQVALRIDVSEKTIYNEIRRAKSRGETVADPQMDLFG